MKIKLDENMPEGLAIRRRALGYDVHTVPEESLAGHNDPDIWAAAQAEGRFLITQDLDFSDVRHGVPTDAPSSDGFAGLTMLGTLIHSPVRISATVHCPYTKPACLLINLQTGRFLILHEI